MDLWELKKTCAKETLIGNHEASQTLLIHCNCWLPKLRENFFSSARLEVLASSAVASRFLSSVFIEPCPSIWKPYLPLRPLPYDYTSFYYFVQTFYQCNATHGLKYFLIIPTRADPLLGWTFPVPMAYLPQLSWWTCQFSEVSVYALSSHPLSHSTSMCFNWRPPFKRQTILLTWLTLALRLQIDVHPR